MLVRCLAAALATLLVAAFPAVAQAKQMDARERPTASTILTLENEKCERDARKFEGVTVARARVCIYVYKLDPTADDDTDRDFRVVWAQSNVNSIPGWCVQKAHTEITLPAGNDIVQSVPAEAQTVDEATAATVTLDLSEAVTQASVSKALTYLKGTVEGTERSVEATESTSAHELVKLTWQGSTDRKLGFALGLELGQPAGSAMPEISFGVRYPVKQGSC